MTMDGKILVDGVLASCYAFSDHDMAHIGMTPVRWFPRLIEMIFGKHNESPDYINVVDGLANIMFPSEIN